MVIGNHFGSSMRIRARVAFHVFGPRDRTPRLASELAARFLKFNAAREPRGAKRPGIAKPLADTAMSYAIVATATANSESEAETSYA